MPNKYGAKKTIVDGIKFDSKFESTRYQELKLLERSKAITGLQRQIKFELIPKQKGEQACVYIADFVYFENGKPVVEDTKSPVTVKEHAYIIKRKLMKQIYPQYEFREVVK
jgi:hypothetical protein